MASSFNLLSVCSFNMFGFTNGFSMLNDLCASNSLIAVQEHWLLESQLNKFNLICNDFNFKAVSGMNTAAAKGIIKGRPFGGVGFFVA